MHEVSIAKSILDVVRLELESRALLGPVKHIYFVCGQINAVVPEALLFAFDAMKQQEPGFASTELKIEQVPTEAKCRVCEHSTRLDKPLFLCEKCGEFMDLVSGDTMFVASFDCEEGT